jgi:ribonuclease R
MPDLEHRILATLSKPNYAPLKPKALARRVGVPGDDYASFRRVLRELVDQGRVEMGKNHTVRPLQPHGTVTGIYRKTGSGVGFVRPHAIDGHFGPEVIIYEENAADAATGDEVLVKLTRRPSHAGQAPAGVVLRVLERATRQFVGTYFERDGQGLVRVDGAVFSHSIDVGDPGAKGAKPDDKVVFEMIRFPTVEERGEGVITEILGPRGKPGVDTLSIIRAFGLPDAFPEDVLEEARAAADAFDEKDLAGREDFSADTIVTIDPDDARDFDDAVSLIHDSKSKHWLLAVHIADVSHFAPTGSLLDKEARKRATSVYLPQRVLPMFPEVISNHLASLQQGRVRYVKSAIMDFTPTGVRTSARFAEGAIRVTRRFTYRQVMRLLEAEEAGEAPPFEIEPEVHALVLRMRDLGRILRKRRLKRGALELSMPETELEYDSHGKVTGAHLATNDESHQIIEEFMLAANEAVAEQLASLDVSFLRRVHTAPDPNKLKAFAEFVRILGYTIEKEQDRFSLQRILQQSADRPDQHAVHYALLRSLKQAVYSPEDEGHYALASEDYCHFTSPIRRYPDLTVHRQLARWLHRGKAGADVTELVALGDHCSKMERRAESAERELIKLRLLDYLSSRIGTDMDAVITGVADYGFFAQAVQFPVEGRVHVSTLGDDYYYFEEASHSLIGRRTGRRYRLGDRVKVSVVRVDLHKRQADFRVAGTERPDSERRDVPERRPYPEKRRGKEKRRSRRRDS